MRCLNQEDRKGEMEERRVTLTSYHMGIKRIQMAFSAETSPYSEPSSLRDVSQVQLLLISTLLFSQRRERFTLSPKQV